MNNLRPPKVGNIVLVGLSMFLQARAYVVGAEEAIKRCCPLLHRDFSSDDISFYPLFVSFA